MPDVVPTAAPSSGDLPPGVVTTGHAPRASHNERMAAAIKIAAEGPPDVKEGGDDAPPAAAKGAKAAEKPAAEAKDKPAAEEPAEKPAAAEKKADPAAFKAIRKAEKALEADRANVERAKAEVNAQATAHAAELRSGREAVKELAELRTLAKDNPAELIRRLGLDWNRTTAAMVEADTPEAKLAALEARLAARESGESEAKQKADAEAAQRHAEQKAQIEGAYVTAIRDGAAEYPMLARYTDAGLIRAGHTLSQQMTEANGKRPTLTELLTELHKRVSDHLASSGPAAPAETPAATTTPTDKGTGKPSKPEAKPPTSLSHQHTAETSGRVRKRTHNERFAAALKL
jgi:hypothetical protein